MLPRRRFGAQWALELTTADPEAAAGSISYGARTEVPVTSRSIVIMKRADVSSRRAPGRRAATYRLQLDPRFGFAAARELIPYLRDLGISHLYLSPSLQARPGSPARL